MKLFLSFLVFASSFLAYAEETAQPPQNLLIFYPSLGVQGQTYPTTPQSGQPDPTGIQSSPLIAFLGIEFDLPLDTNLYLDLGLEIHTKEYVYKPLIGHAFPTSIETGADAGVVAGVLGLFPYAEINLHIPTELDNYLKLTAGLSFGLRLALTNIDNSGDIGLVSEDLLGNFRIPNLKIGVAHLFKVNANLSFGPKIGFHLPLYRLWDGDNFSILDRSITQFGFEILTKL